MISSQEPISIVCFGDSLTWGFNPVDRSRYGHSLRWPRLMQAELGNTFHVIEDGLNSRTTVYEDPITGDKNGLAHLATALKVHMPIDILVIMLGTNNLKARFCLGAEDIAQSLTRLLELATRSECGPGGRPPKVLLMAPPITGNFTGTPFEAQFSGEKTHAISSKFKETYPPIAEQYGAAFFDTSTVVTVSPLDAIHLAPEMQGLLATAVAAEIRKIV